MKIRNLFLIFIFLLLLIFSPACYCEELSIYDEGVNILREYISIDTTNPPGNEMETALYLKEILDREGIENEVFDLGDNRANLFAVIRGDGSKRPVILLHHMDVVPADREYWKTDPFSGDIIDGEIYGRGAVDIKAKGIIDLMAMINLKRMGFPLKRDIILLAVSDEEVGSLGTKWMIENKPELIEDAEFLIDEGACVIVNENGGVRFYWATIGEKAPLWLTVKFTGKAGHGSVPFEDSSVNKALRAANRILDYNWDFILIPEAGEYIKMLLSDIDITKISGYSGDFENSLKNEIFLKEISKNPEINACLRNTIAITSMAGSDEINTIPNEASLGLDCRLLPGTDPYKFMEKLKEVIDDDTAEIEIIASASPSCSPWNNDFSKALETCAENINPGTKVITSILLSSTDSTFFRSMGIECYGFEPYRLTFEERDLAHGNDERIKVENIKFGIDLLTELLKELNN